MRVVTECAVRTIENITTSYASRNNRLALEYARLNTARFELLLQESKSVESILLKEQS